MIQHIGSWLIAIAAVYPVAIRLAELGSKPVEYEVIKGYSRGDAESHYRFKFG